MSSERRTGVSVTKILGGQFARRNVAQRLVDRIQGNILKPMLVCGPRSIENWKQHLPKKKNLPLAIENSSGLESPHESRS